MGERRTDRREADATVNLQSALAGQYGFNDWIGQQDNLATPRGVIPAILPVQEMREFQRRYLFDTGSQSLIAGERISLLSWTVPDNEYWKPLQLLYQNADNINHNILCNFSMARSPAAVAYRTVDSVVAANSTKVVYGLDNDGPLAGGTQGFFFSRIPVTMEPLDIFDFTDSTPNNGASQQRWIFVYELVPQPATQRTPGVAAAVTVV